MKESKLIVDRKDWALLHSCEKLSPKDNFFKGTETLTGKVTKSIGKRWHQMLMVLPLLRRHQAMKEEGKWSMKYLMKYCTMKKVNLLNL
eukprot:11671145-Ditylum_brightwellii.AAC.1